MKQRMEELKQEEDRFREADVEFFFQQLTRKYETRIRKYKLK